MKSIILSIHPQWAELIYSGEKTFELRKRVPQKVSRFYQSKNQKKGYARFSKYLTCAPIVYLYETGTGLVTGYFTLGNIYGVDMCEMTGKTSRLITKHSCVPWTDVLSYYKGCFSLFVWIVQRPERFKEPKSLASFNINRAPQSWSYWTGGTK